jgi:hypothetical protein
MQHALSHPIDCRLPESEKECGALELDPVRKARK